MSDAARTIAHFLGFAALLRRSDFAVAPEQIDGLARGDRTFRTAGIGDIRRSARATLAPPPERFAEFDALFDAHFLGAIVPGLEGEPSEEEPLNAAEDSAGGPEPIFGEETREFGRTSDDRRTAYGPPFRSRRRGRNTAPFLSRAAGAHAETARLPLAFRARRRRHRCAAHVSRCHAACRRDHQPAAPAAPAAPAPRSLFSSTYPVR